jgi:AAA+ superfamily predicted ATPase
MTKPHRHSVDASGAALDEPSLARREYDLQLHAAYLRLCRAVVQSDHVRSTLAGREAETADAAPYIATELELVERGIAELAADDGEPRPMLELAERMGWSDDEVGFVWAVVALAVNPRLLVHARALDDTATRGLSVALYGMIARLAPGAARDLGLALIPGHSAMRSGLIIPSPGDWIPSAVPWSPTPEFVRYLAGEATRSGLLVEVRAPSDPILDPAQERALGQIAAILNNTQPLVLFVEGPELTGRRSAVALAVQRPVIALDLTQIGPSPTQLAEALTVLRRDAALRGAVPLVAGVQELIDSDGSEGDGRLRILAQHVELANGPVVLVSTWRGLEVDARMPTVRIEWPIPDVATRGLLWRAAAGADWRDAGYDQIAMRFPLGAGAVQRAVASARVLSNKSTGDQLSSSELLAGLRQNIAERMGGLAERAVVKQSWDDLVLAEDVMAQVRTLVGRVRHSHLVYEQWGYRSKMPRGMGVAALFSGPPGTGKTLVAGLIARELELELYQVDLSKIVSKWVGETEKQLAKVFDAAEAGHVLLLFDEADALFGQRSTEMKGATDRYANLEVNFLLTRIETFNGVTILTTNLDSAIDKALKRRLAAHVVFQAPDDDERARLWERLLNAQGAPLDRNIDARALARQFPKMSGANIRNAALGAAFLAAAEGRQRIVHATVAQAARNEYLSMGHVLASTPGL